KNVIVAKELSRIVQNENIRTYSLHPGVINTNINHMNNRYTTYFINLVVMMFEISAEQGAINTLYPVLSPENKETGEYYNEGIKQEPSKVANDQEVADKLWKEWIKKKIKDVEYSEFKDVKEIGKRGFGVVNRVATNDGMQVALKSIIEKKTSKLEDDDIKKFVNEIKLVRMVGFHQCQWLSWNIKGCSILGNYKWTSSFFQKVSLHYVVAFVVVIEKNQLKTKEVQHSSIHAINNWNIHIRIREYIISGGLFTSGGGEDKCRNHCA
ncbi:hypothetical protein RhiirA1_501831, partial [Rhizophagus irregularis]